MDATDTGLISVTALGLAEDTGGEMIEGVTGVIEAIAGDSNGVDTLEVEMGIPEVASKK